jgi:hypothetical protein
MQEIDANFLGFAPDDEDAPVVEDLKFYKLD